MACAGLFAQGRNEDKIKWGHEYSLLRDASIG